METDLSQSLGAEANMSVPKNLQGNLNSRNVCKEERYCSQKLRTTKEEKKEGSNVIKSNLLSIQLWNIFKAR
jgi:hypothetical protein